MSVSGPSVDLTPTGDGGGDELEEEEAPEPAGPFGAEAFQETADPSMFQNTYLARATDWAIAEPTPSPAPYPLQVIPRVAYTINFNMIWDPAVEKWVPDEGNESGAASGVTKVAQKHVDEVSDLSVSSGFPATTVPLAAYQEQATDPDGIIDEDNDWYFPAEAGTYLMFYGMQYDDITTGNTWQAFLSVRETGGIMGFVYDIANQEVFADGGFETVTGVGLVTLTDSQAVQLRTVHSTGVTESISDFETNVYLGGCKIA